MASRRSWVRIPSAPPKSILSPMCQAAQSLHYLCILEVSLYVSTPVFVAFLFRFIGEVEFGFLVYDERPNETVRGSGARNVDGYGQNARYALLQVENVG
jgi:hypothetical protein